MRVDVTVPVYNCGAELQLLVESLRSRHDVVLSVYLHSEHEPTIRASTALNVYPWVRLFPYGVNRGLSRTWNDAMLGGYASGADVVLLVNDDIQFGPGDLDSLAEKAVHHRECPIVTVAGTHAATGRPHASHGYACFAINPIALDVLGCFDENFFPAYCEDIDYARRARLAGLAECSCSSTSVVHGGSRTIAREPELARRNAATHAANEVYYARKWGGTMGAERFAVPFGEPRYGLRIRPEDRHAPYGPHDRPDLTGTVDG